MLLEEGSIGETDTDRRGTRTGIEFRAKLRVGDTSARKTGE